MLITSMVIFGTIGLLVRNIPLPSAEIALYRAVLAAVLLGSYFLIAGQNIQIRTLGKELPLLILSGAAMGFNWILLFEAYNYTTVSVATLSYYFAPVIIILACPILFREKMLDFFKNVFIFNNSPLQRLTLGKVAYVLVYKLWVLAAVGVLHCPLISFKQVGFCTVKLVGSKAISLNPLQLCHKCSECRDSLSVL